MVPCKFYKRIEQLVVVKHVERGSRHAILADAVAAIVSCERIELKLIELIALLLLMMRSVPSGLMLISIFPFSIKPVQKP